MNVTVNINIPDELAQALDESFENLGRAPLEALSAEAYGKDVLSLAQVQRLLDLDSRWEAQFVLSRHSVWPGQSAEEIL